MSQAGIYIHIPFCRSRCTYCAFNTGDYQPDIGTTYVGAVRREIECADKATAGVAVDSIFFGGGTPSILPAEELISILETCRQQFQLAPDTEITVEINPGTLTPAKIAAYRAAGINRASLGVQSFINRELEFIGRIHSADEARSSIEMLRAGGFDNISLDLIAGLPYQTIADWRFNLREALKLQTEHLSIYLLEIHEGTPLYHQVKRGEVARPDEDLSVEMYYEMVETTAAAGMEQYEISNFARSRAHRSRHNLKYWSDVPYYGFGCGAHAYDGQARWWNIKPPRQYSELITTQGQAIAERTELSWEERRQEALFLGLRRLDGVDVAEFQHCYGLDIKTQYAAELDRFLAAELLQFEGNNLKLTRAGLALSNEVFAAFI